MFENLTDEQLKELLQEFQDNKGQGIFNEGFIMNNPTLFDLDWIKANQNPHDTNPSNIHTTLTGYDSGLSTEGVAKARNLKVTFG